MTQMHTSNPNSKDASNSSRSAPPRNCVVVGGSSGVGRALVSQLCASGDSVLAIARDRKDLEALQSDCLLRHGTPIRILAADLTAQDFDSRTLVDRCTAELGTVSHLFLPVGAIHPADRGVPPPEVLASLTTLNYLRPAQLIGAFCNYFSTRGSGNIMIFSTIAVAAPRANNAAYASAKAALEFYCRALQHHFSASNIRIQICALGYVDSSMTFGSQLRFPVSTPSRAARFALRMSRGHARFSYFPRFWYLVVTILRMTPWPIYKRLRF
jgi:short-subunit dehydrogenase